LEAEWADPREIEGEEMGRRNPRAQEEEGKNPRLDDKLGKIPQKTSEGKKKKKKQRLDDDPKKEQERRNDKSGPTRTHAYKSTAFTCFPTQNLQNLGS
jgi:hypothetical protein